MKTYCDGEGRYRLRQLNGEDSTTGCSRDLRPTHDLSGTKVCHYCWLPTHAREVIEIWRRDYNEV